MLQRKSLFRVVGIMLLVDIRVEQMMPLFPTEMESDRLQYERLHPDDFDAFELYEHVRVGAPAVDELTEHLPWDPYATPKAAFDWVEQCGENFVNGVDATYVVRPKDGERAGELAGLASLHPDWDRQAATLGTWFRKPFWGHGYSGERAARLFKLAFDRLDLGVVTVTTDPENEKSRRAIEKYVERFGGREEGLIRHDVVIDGEPRDSIRWSITQEEWKRNRD